MTIDKPLTYVDYFYGDKIRRKRVSPKVSNIILQRKDPFKKNLDKKKVKSFSEGGPVLPDKPKPPSNVIPLIPNPNSPFGSNNPDGWTKADFVTDAKADIEFYRSQLSKIYGGGVMKLKKSELKELLQFHIDNGGI